MSPIRLAAVLAALALFVAGPVQAATTNTYDSGSTSDNIALSCKDLSITASGTNAGKLSATCNKSSGGSVVGNSTSIDMDDLVYCYVTTNLGPVIYFGTDSYDGSISGWSVSASSSGKKYNMGGTCNMDDGSSGTSVLDISETGTSASSGLKNTAGKLEKR